MSADGTFSAIVEKVSRIGDAMLVEAGVTILDDRGGKYTLAEVKGFCERPAKRE